MATEVNEIDEIGSIRSHSGTALTDVAGAAAYWNKRALKIEKASSKKWKDGFLTGFVSSAILIGGSTALMLHLFN